MSAGLTQLIRSLELMTLIKNLNTLTLAAGRKHGGDDCRRTRFSVGSIGRRIDFGRDGDIASR
jgi:hypothetical protein